MLEDSSPGLQFREIEKSIMQAQDRLRPVENSTARAYEVGLHLFPDSLQTRYDQYLPRTRSPAVSKLTPNLNFLSVACYS
jgi:hypothetical protein